MSEVTPGAAAQVPMNASQDGIPGVVPELSNVRGLITTPHAVLGSTQSDIIPASTMNLDIATIQDANETTKSVQTAEAHQDSVAEKAAEHVVEEVQDKADTEQGQEELKDDIEDNIESADLSDDIALDEALDDIVDELVDGALDAEVIGVEAGKEQTVTVEGGERVGVELEAGEDYAVYVTEEGETTIIIDETLSVEEAADATTDALADIVHDVASQNGVDLDSNFGNSFRTGFMASVYFTPRSLNIMIGGKDLYVVIAERTGENEDEMVTRAINEEQTIAENRSVWRKIHK